MSPLGSRTEFRPSRLGDPAADGRPPLLETAQAAGRSRWNQWWVLAVEILLAASYQITNLKYLKQLRILITSYKYSQGKVIAGLFKLFGDATKVPDSCLSSLPSSACWLLGWLSHGHRVAAIMPGVTSLHHKIQRSEGEEGADLILMLPLKKEEKFPQSPTFQKISHPFHWPEFYQMLIPDWWWGKMVRASDSQLCLRLNWGEGGASLKYIRMSRFYS